MRRLRVPLGLACVTLAVAACGGSGHHAKAHRNVPSPSQIRQAATRTAAEPGFEAQISAAINVSQLENEAITGTGSGSFDPRSKSGALQLSVRLPAVLGAVGPLPSRVILAGGEAYAQVPAKLASTLGTSFAWLEVSPAQLGLGALDPPTVLSQIARDATRPIRDQHAKVTLDPATGLIRTIVLSYNAAGGDHVHVHLRFTGFHAVPATQAPPASSVGSLASALKQIGF